MGSRTTPATTSIQIYSPSAGATRYLVWNRYGAEGRVADLLVERLVEVVGMDAVVEIDEIEIDGAAALEAEQIVDFGRHWW